MHCKRGAQYGPPPTHTHTHTPYPTPHRPPADRENLRLAQQEFQSLPLSILLQLAVAAAVCVMGGLQASGEFKPIAIADTPRWATAAAGL